MNPIFQYIIIEAAKNKFKKKKIKPSSKQIEREVQNAKVELTHFIRDSFLILLGVLSASFGLNGFLLPNSFLDGGVTGISLITSELTGISLSVLIVLINIPFMVIAYSTISRQFAVRSIIAILLLAFTIHLFPVTTITDDKLLIAVFGGFFLGLGIGLAVRGGSVIDGTEVLAVFISRKTSMTIGDVILIFNIIIFAVAAYVFSIEIALYAILTYLAASKTVDFVITGVEEYIGVTIISDKSEEIRLAIIENLGRGCTLYSGKKGFAKRGEPLKQTDIVYTLVTRLELSKLQTELDKIDKDAFIVMHSIKDAKGGMIKKRPLK
ncbi:MAG: YitT family protein [Saprospiraceae bacterium]|nr:YitT family protein [Saprospiraceae bacterium]